MSGWTALVFLLGPLFILSVGLQWAVEDDADDQSDRLDVLRDKVRTLEKIEDATVERLQASYEATYPQWERIRTAERPISSVDRLAEILAIRNVVAGLMLDIPKRLDGYRPFLRSGGVMRVAYFEPVAGFLVPVASVAGGLANQVSVGEHDPRFSVEDPDNPGSLAAWCAWHARGDRNPAIISDTRAYVQAPRAPDDPPFAFFSKRQAGKVRSILGYSCGMGPLSVRPTPVIMLDIDIAEYFLESDLSAYALRKILHHFAHHLAYQSDMLKLLEGEIS